MPVPSSTAAANGQPHPRRPGGQQVAQPGAVAAADPHARQGALDRVVGHVVLARVARVLVQHAHERGGTGRHRRLEHLLELDAEGQHVLAGQRRLDIQRARRRGGALGQRAGGGHEVARHAQQGDVVERGPTGHRVGGVGVERRQLDVEPVDRHREGHGEAVDRGGRAVGGGDLERPLRRLPAPHLDRLEAHVPHAEGAEPLGGPPLDPLVGRVAGPADALVDHLGDPPEDGVLVGHVAAADLVPTDHVDLAHVHPPVLPDRRPHSRLCPRRGHRPARTRVSGLARAVTVAGTPRHAT